MIVKGKTLLFCSFHQHPHLSLGPMKDRYGWHEAVQGPSTLPCMLLPEVQQKDTVRCGTLGAVVQVVHCQRTTAANLDFTFVENAFIFIDPKIDFPRPLSSKYPMETTFPLNISWWIKLFWLWSAHFSWTPQGRGREDNWGIQTQRWRTLRSAKPQVDEMDAQNVLPLLFRAVLSNPQPGIYVRGRRQPGRRKAGA